MENIKNSIKRQVDLVSELEVVKKLPISLDRDVLIDCLIGMIVDREISIMQLSEIEDDLNSCISQMRR